MSKEAAMALATGQPVAQVNPSLITGDMGGTVNPELTPTETPPAAQQVKETIDSDRFAMIAKKEAKLVKEREEFKKEQTAIQEERAKLKAYVDKIEAFEAKRKADPIAALKDIGFTDTEIYNALAEGGGEKKEPTTEEIARAAAAEEVTKFKTEQEKIAAEAQKAKEQSLVTEYTTKISSAIKANPEKYEYSNYYGKVAEELAVEFATENVKLNGELLSPEEVAEAIEAYYEEQDKAMSQLKKRQPKETTPGPTGTIKTEPARTRTVVPPVGAPPPAPSKTLTNKATATVASTVARRETHEQKKERLIAALKAGTYQAQS
jgi:hypothetical protein